MKIDNKKKNTIWLMLLVCSLLLGGCSAGDTTGQRKNTVPEDMQPENAQVEDAQSDRIMVEGTSEADGSAQTQSTGITEQEAFAVALEHAGVEEANVTSSRITRDYEGSKEIYDVEFYADGKEYDYEIGVADGSIVQANFEIEKNSDSTEKNQGTEKANNNNDNNNKEITEADAKKIALAKVPGAKNIRIEKDMEDGKVIYEGEIHYNNMEYEFEIDAATGKILKWEEDKED